MPELPDVEAQRRILAAHAVGHAVLRVSVPAPDVCRNTSPQGLGRAVHDRRLTGARRHGKWLIALGGGDLRLVFHFGMTGRLVVTSPGERDDPHDRVVLHLDDTDLRLRMSRKLGGVWLARSEAQLAEVTGPLGPDAWRLGAAALRDRLGGGRGALKSALMDQSKVAGLGNLLVDELLWQACLSPERPVASLDEGVWQTLAECLERVLAVALDAGCVPPAPGWLTAIRDDPDPSCPRCGAALQRDTIAGRGTVRCPSCQPRRS